MDRIKLIMVKIYIDICIKKKTNLKQNTTIYLIKIKKFKPNYNKQKFKKKKNNKNYANLDYY